MAYQMAIAQRRPHAKQLTQQLICRASTLDTLQAMGWKEPPFRLLHALRPILSLAPLDQDLLHSSLAYLKILNSSATSSLEDYLRDGSPVLAIISCRSRLSQAQETRDAFRDWEKAKIIKPIIVVGSPKRADWLFRFYPKHGELQIPCRDDYDFLPHKILTLLWILGLLHQTPSILKIDDDARPADHQKATAIFNKIQASAPKAAGVRIATPTRLHLDRGWHIGKSSIRNNSKPFSSLGAERWMSGGAGYFLNGSAVASLGEYAMHSWGFIESMVYEDVCVSLLIDACHGRIQWIDNPLDMGIATERQSEIQQGLWENP